MGDDNEFFGMRIVTDPSLPPGRVEFRGAGQKLLGAIEGLELPPGSQPSPNELATGTAVFRVQVDEAGRVKATHIKAEDFYRPGADQEGEGK